MIIGPKIYGLVLAGGKSTRMGKDKGLITYHGMPQREYLYHLLSRVCERTYLSLRNDQVGDVSDEFDIIVDKDEFKGPFNGLLSAHEENEEVAWLVLACDLPLIDLQSLQELISGRDPNEVATTFAHHENPLPEPMCAIWEPTALKQVASYLNEGNGTCPRKFLIRKNAKLIIPRDENVLMNANSEEDYKEALVKLSIE
ncbi:molybdenum cofactor guanylyltransferase [Euzebyella marina]|uniref:molybdenum cofactor guanylyltransferase n=1 Tax=Euzebyella marina TaxID=1761453 RepID=UPI002685D9EE|nr:NTP transferase domain-containing protein [Euzebyella marina]